MRQQREAAAPCDLPLGGGKRCPHGAEPPSAGSAATAAVRAVRNIGAVQIAQSCRAGEP
ncbi:hypothetical protein BLAT2472_40022 [Burkholderia latens]